MGHDEIGSGGADSEQTGADAEGDRKSGTHLKRGIVDVVTEVGSRLSKRKSRPKKRRVRVADLEPELDEASGA